MNILIIEDEPRTAALLKEFILSYQGGYKVTGISESIEKSVLFFQQQSNQPDLVFMDIQLADGGCFEIFSQVKVNCPVIFCTANEQHTLEAFKSNGIGYILKPFTEQDIHDVLDKVRKLSETFSPRAELLRSVRDALSAPGTYKTSLLIRYRESYIPIAVDKIAMLLLENGLLYACTFDHQKYSVFKPIDEMEKSLDPRMFFRVNRQMLLNRAAVNEIKPYFNRKLIIITPLNLTEHPVVSRLKVAAFLQWIEQS